jgi:hypothetical protein
MNEHIFEILGISSREDSYTDLIAYALKESSGFRKNLLARLGEQDHGDWEYRTRLPVSIVSETGRQKDVPDLIFFSKRANKILLIENKVFSGEGWKQTERYASDDFKSSLEDNLKMINPKFKFFFLTIDGTTPYSRVFSTASYLDISDAIPKKLTGSKLDLLLEEFQERINEYYCWPLPNSDDVVLEYLKNKRRLVSSYRTFEIVAENLLPRRFGFSEECAVTANRGSGFIPLYIWHKESWRSKEYPEEKDGAKCYDIHFEFQWDTREDWESLTLYLHYHTSPYMTQSELKDIPREFVDKYKNRRNALFEYIQQKKPNGFILSNTPLRLAYYTFENNVRFGQLKEMTTDLIANMTTIVDDYFETSRRG